jgi:hypothetical protein
MSSYTDNLKQENEQLKSELAELKGLNQLSKAGAQSMSARIVVADIMAASIKELKTELAALKASIPQIKHDAIMGMVDYAKEMDILFWSDSDAIQYAKNVLAQAKELKK